MKKKIAHTLCSVCGADASETFLEKIKGTDKYICEYCEIDKDQYGFNAIAKKKLGESYMGGVIFDEDE